MAVREKHLASNFGPFPHSTQDFRYTFTVGVVRQRENRETVLPDLAEYESLESQYGVM